MKQVELVHAFSSEQLEILLTKAVVKVESQVYICDTSMSLIRIPPANIVICVIQMEP